MRMKSESWCSRINLGIRSERGTNAAPTEWRKVGGAAAVLSCRLGDWKVLALAGAFLAQWVGEEIPNSRDCFLLPSIIVL